MCTIHKVATLSTLALNRMCGRELLRDPGTFRGDSDDVRQARLGGRRARPLLYAKSIPPQQRNGRKVGKHFLDVMAAGGRIAARFAQ